MPSPSLRGGEGAEAAGKSEAAAAGRAAAWDRSAARRRTSRTPARLLAAACASSRDRLPPPFLSPLSPDSLPGGVKGYVLSTNHSSISG
ncbi:UNVERIFIED_CONTAM: hypothetical protein K2H54_018206 [Gekko kuhli]